MIDNPNCPDHRLRVGKARTHPGHLEVIDEEGVHRGIITRDSWPCCLSAG